MISKIFGCAYVIGSLAKHRILFLCFLSLIPFIPRLHIFLLAFHPALRLRFFLSLGIIPPTGDFKEQGQA